MTPEQLKNLKEEMAVEVEMMRDESLYIVEMSGRKYNLHDGSLSETPSPKGYFSAESLLNDIEYLLKKHKTEKHIGFAIILKAVE